MMKMTRILEVPETLQAPVAAMQQADAALITALAFTIFGLILVVHTRLQRLSQERQAAEHQAALGRLAQTIETMGSRIERIDGCMQQLVQRVEQIQLSHSRGNNDLRQAIHLVRDGATTDQLVDLCGLSPGEAELFQRLHS